jgi:hypothetical protein
MLMRPSCVSLSRCASQVFGRGAQAAALLYVAGTYRGAKANARGAAQVLHRGAQAFARGAARCASLKLGHVSQAGCCS